MAPRLTNMHEYAFRDSAETYHREGFDKSEKFQMLAVGASRVFAIADGSADGMSVELTPAGFCQFPSPPDLTYPQFQMRGIIFVKGVAEGTTKLVLKDKTGKSVDSVEIKVVNERVVKTRFYDLHDSEGRRGVRNDFDPSYEVSALTKLIDAVNLIVYDQCFVKMVASGEGRLRNLSFNKDLKGFVNIDDVNIFASSDKDGEAEFHAAFTWGIAGPHSNGITKSNVSLIQSNLPEAKREITMAHEFVHFLCGSGIVTTTDHDKEQNDLMFLTAPHGILMRKERLLKVIRK